MAIVNSKNNLRKKIKYISNPAIEMVASLHVLSEPEHHVKRIEWAGRVVESLDDDLYEKIKFVGDKYNQWSYIMDVVEVACHDCNDTDDVEAILLHIENMSDEEFVLYFLGETYVLTVERASGWLKNPSSIRSGNIKDMTLYIDMGDLVHFLENISYVRNEISDIFRRYWNDCFSNEWEGISKAHGKKIDKEKNILMDSDPGEYILKLNKVFVLEDYTLIMLKNKAYQMNIDLVDNIYILPSLFTAPHLMLNTHANNVTVYMNIAEQDVKKIPRELMENIKAISDETRILILKALTRESRTTKELAEAFGFAPATISQHLKLLKNAGLVKNQKIKNYVYYSAKKEKIEKTIKDLIKYFAD